jgi:hypothetical protein
MSESKEYRLILSSGISQRIEKTAKRVYVQPEQFILYLILLSLKDLETGVKSIPFYRKLLLKLEKESAK